MTEDPIDPQALPFSQAFGYEPLPQQLELEYLSSEARVGIWNAVYELAAPEIRLPRLHPHWHNLLALVHSRFFGLPSDEWPGSATTLRNDVRYHIQHEPFNKVFDLLLFMMRSLHEMNNGRVFATQLTTRIAETFADHHVAYYLDATQPPTIYPASTPEERVAVVDALQQLNQAGLVGAHEHLRRGAACINDNDWAGAVRESIHAVESVARQIAPDARTLADALNVLERRGLLEHPALKDGFAKIYGYTSDEQGVRHALLNQPASNVGQDEAMFMFGACASFASYLSRKQLEPDDR